MSALDYVLLVSIMLEAETIDRETLVHVFRTVYHDFSHVDYLQFQSDVREMMSRRST